MVQLAGNDLADLQAKLRNLRILIIDEISLIAAMVFWPLHCRMCPVNQTPEAMPFGGICVILTGDFWQLPPCFGSNMVSHMYARARTLQQSAVSSSDEEGQDQNLAKSVKTVTSPKESCSSFSSA